DDVLVARQVRQDPARDQAAARDHEHQIVLAAQSPGEVDDEPRDVVERERCRAVDRDLRIVPPGDEIPRSGHATRPARVISLDADTSVGVAARTNPPRGRWKDIDVTVKAQRLRTAGAALLTLAATLVFAGAAQAAAPTITSFSPTSGSLGSSV